VDRLDGPLDWDESGPAPCFTDKPGWDGYGGTLLLAAHDEHPELPPPALVSADWPDDPAYLAASARGAGSRYNQPLTPELWLPAGSTSPSAPRTSPARRSRSGPAWPCSASWSCWPPATARTTGPPEPAADGHSLSAAAAGGLAVLLRLAERSVVCRVPMRLDF
jgi:hypothetical protein